jgi:hypothetical protein
MPVDAQKLRERLSEPGRDPEQDVEVTFILSHQDFDYLARVAEEIGDLLADHLDVEYDSVVIENDEHPKVGGVESKQAKPPPQSTLTYAGPLTADQFTMLHELVGKLAIQHEITYQGVKWWCG